MSDIADNVIANGVKLDAISTKLDLILANQGTVVDNTAVLDAIAEIKKEINPTV